jgi:DNA primase
MELTIQEVNYYNDLVKNNKALKIECPFNENEEFPDIVISKIDSSEKVFFYCLGCQTSFYPGINLIEKIKGYISLSTS